MRTGRRKAVRRGDGRDVHLGDGRYRLLEQLGSGGMSVVWRAHDELLDRAVAVKVLASKLASDASFRQRIMVEARAAAGLAHPHVTAVYDYGESALSADVSVPYVVMELVDGESLADRLRRTGPLPWRTAVTTGAEVAAALAAAHARGVVHRDVTTHNVMLTHGGAKVVDFGISALIGQRDSGSDGSLLGTPAYLAPERLTGGPVSSAADVYALGLVLYRSLSGRLPWPVESTAQVLRAHLWTDAAPLPPIDGLPAAVADLCLRCLAKVPAERPSSADLARGLAGVVGLTPVLPTDACPEPPVEHVAPLRGPRGRSAADDLPGRRPGTRRAGPDRPPSAPHVRRTRRTRAPVPARPGRRLRATATSLALLLAASVGWVMSDRGTPAEPTPQAAAPVQTVVVAPAADDRCRVRFHVRRDSGTGFDASVAVTNTGSDPLTDWRLDFVLRGDQRITSAGAATVDQSGRQVTLRPADPAPLGARAVAHLRLTGKYRDSNRLPAAFTVDGTPCSSVVSATGLTGDRGTVSAADKASDAGRKKKSRTASSSGGSSAGSAAGSDAGPTTPPVSSASRTTRRKPPASLAPTPTRPKGKGFGITPQPLVV